MTNYKIYVKYKLSHDNKIDDRLGIRLLDLDSIDTEREREKDKERVEVREL